MHGFGLDPPVSLVYTYLYIVASTTYYDIIISAFKAPVNIYVSGEFGTLNGSGTG